MKRSRYVALVGMGASALVLSACEDPNAVIPAKAYPSVAACVSDGNPEAACANAYYSAEDAYQSNYPKYASRYDCEDYAGEGKCEADYPNSRNHSWRPLMTGFLVGHALANRVQPQPLIASARSPSGRATAGGVAFLGRGVNGTIPARAASAPSASQIAKAHTGAATTARGGFGGTAAKVSTAASSSSRSSGG